MVYLRNLVYLTLLGVVLSLCGCTAVEEPDICASSPGSITLALIAGGTSSRAGIVGSPDELSPATDEERRIADLRYFIFPVGEEGAVRSGRLTPPPSAAESAEEKYKEYRIDNIPVGRYRVYVVANVPECAGATTEAGLRGIVLNHGADALPEVGNLPMVYEPLEDTVVGEQGGMVIANMHFTCVKIRYNIIFDEDSKNAFGRSGLMITSVSGHKLTSQTPLVLPARMDAMHWSGGTFDASLPLGRYFGVWTRNDNPSADGDVIMAGNAAPAHYTDPWLYQGTLYLPERYASSADEESVLTVEGSIVDASYSPNADGTVSTAPVGSVAAYTIPLGHNDAGDGALHMPRGTYYEIIAHIASRDVTELQAEVLVRDWHPVRMADFGHTVLIVDKTRASVTSLDNDSIGYLSNASEVELGCDELLEGKPVIVLSEHDVEKHVITFGINPAIPIGAFKEGSAFPPRGTTRIWLQANNMRKYLDVDYEVTPLFEVTPVSAEIFWLEDADEHPTYTKIFSYRTNLGGIRGLGLDMQDYIHVQGNSQVHMRCENPDAAIGTFAVTAEKNPVTTTDHMFTVAPADAGYVSMACAVTVTVKPPVGDYRVHFRAINDRQGAIDWWVAEYNDNLLPEGISNWDDSWNKSHHIYAYTQFGETVGGSIPEYYVWRFSGVYPGSSMVVDDTANPGWAYYNFAADAAGVNTGTVGSPGDQSVKRIKPGETLLMFNNGNTNGSKGVARFRCPHHLDPGIQLFDFEDREGWILYDPLSDPYYKIYDDRPDVVNVEFRIYSVNKIIGWEVKYGHCNSDNANDMYTINKTYSSWGMEDGLYKTVLHVKCPKGDYAKAIVMKFADGTSSRICGGRNYYDASHPDYVEASCYCGQWQPGLLKQPYDIPSGYKRIYYHNTIGWSQPYLHTWTDGASYATVWPGVAMLKCEDTSDGLWYFVDIPAYADRLIFNNNGASQSSAHVSGEGMEQYFNWNGITAERP